MMNRRLRLRASLLALFFFFFVLLVGQNFFGPALPVRGKSAAVPLPQVSHSRQALAQELALADARVLRHTTGRRAEVFGVRDVLGQYTPASSACAVAICYQVEIYNFDDNAAVLAIVNVDAEQVLDVLHLPGARPGINKRLADLAIEIARNEPQVIEALGFRPQKVEAAPVEAGMVDSVCDGSRLCVAATFNLGERLLWAIVDLTEERLAAITWTDMIAGEPNSSVPFIPQGCPSPGTVERDGWSLAYGTTGTDGFRVHSVSYNGMPILNNVKLVEWHASYGSSGFVDSTGCGGGGGGFPIYPYGETQVLDLMDGQNNVVGFELVQDFRMGNWGNTCNYRYDQRIQFFDDGRFRVVSGAYGKGCGTNATYRPVVRIDVAVDGADNDSFASWDGALWHTHTEEFWQLQSEPYTPEKYKWRLTDQSGAGYYLEPGLGQFGDAGRGDNAYIYVTLHNPAEGDTDLPVIGTCCQNNHEQGPHHYVNGEAIDNQNIVIWYVPQMVTDALPGSYYCWTLQGEPDPVTYPCFSGPMFVPKTHSSFSHNGPLAAGEAAVFSNHSSGLLPLTYQWDFGDGAGTSNEAEPSYIYEETGVYTVTLTTTGANLLSDTITDTVTVYGPPLAAFEHNGPYLALGQTAVFTNSSSGDAPLTYLWEFGDGATSSAANPSHDYAVAGTYTVTLTASNEFGNHTAADTLIIGLPAVAAFSHTGPVAVAETIHFVNDSAGNMPLDYLWQFGDGATATAENPNHAYNAPGSYAVTLTVSNTLAMDSATRLVDVGHAQTTLEPTGGGELSYDAGDGRTITVVVPGGSVAEETALLYTLADGDPVGGPPNLVYAGQAFTLAAYRHGERLPDFTFDLPIAITIGFNGSDLAHLIPASLALHYWDGAGWLAAGTTCATGVATLNPAANELTVSVCHLTQFALFGQPWHELYLPAIVR